jgi:hypothetical protein
MATIDHDKKEKQIKEGPLGKSLNHYHAEEPVEGTELFLEKKAPEKGYSTDPAQGKTDVSLQLADEDRDRHQDPVKEARDLQESYEMHEKSQQ